jgi:hypothetical protein
LILLNEKTIILCSFLQFSLKGPVFLKSYLEKCPPTGWNLL